MPGPLDTWRSYASCWSQVPRERGPALETCVDSGVVYRDPGTEMGGRDELAAYMDGFRNGFPGSRFVIDDVHAHHGRSLARWRQVGPGGTVQMRGISHAVHAPDGALAEITGFFVDRTEGEG